MPYINFKEENTVTRKQIEIRKKNNTKLYIELMKNRYNLEGYTPSEKYSYLDVVDTEIGKKGVLEENNFYEIENEDIVCSKFINCKFNNVKFKHCRFVACTFEGCSFGAGGVVFENCIMIKEDSEKLPSLNRKDNLSCEFNDCNIYAKFLGSDISFCMFNNCSINDTYFEESSMRNVIIADSYLKMITVEDSDFCGLKVINTYIENLEFNDKNCTKFDEKTYFDKIPIKTKTREEYEGIYMIYQAIADKFKENSLNNNFGEYYYLCKCTQRKCVSFFQKILSGIYFITCGYGERPEYALLSSISIIIIFAILYLFSGIDINNEIVMYNFKTIGNFNIGRLFRDLNETINLSVGMFGGVGFNTAKPTESSYMLSNIEMLIGILMMGVGIGTLTRKIVR